MDGRNFKTKLLMYVHYTVNIPFVQSESKWTLNIMSCTKNLRQKVMHIDV